MDYKSSGVDVAAGENAVLAIKNIVRRTYNKNVLGDLGSFGGLYQLDLQAWKAPVLVSSTDGVGTKLRVAIMSQRYSSVGSCLVNHCVNDILVQGAHPQFFLDYIGVAKMDGAIVEQIIQGMVEACQQNSCVLIGGEMAEMPGIYQDGDFDLAGTIVGLVERDQVLPRNVQAGDAVLAFPSNGLHTNGYSLVRKIVFEHLGLLPSSFVDELQATVADLLLAVHRSYYTEIKDYLTNPGLHGLAHITGGGIKGNLKRIMPEALCAELSLSLSEIPPLFNWLIKSGNLSMDTSLEAFNLGIGMIAVTTPALAEQLVIGTDARVVGSIVPRIPGQAAVTVHL